MSNNTLPPELEEKMAEAWSQPNSVQECAQLAVDYCFETFVPLNQQLKDIKQQRDELLEFVNEIYKTSANASHLVKAKQLLKKHEDGKE